jgi:hypothetical protein
VTASLAFEEESEAVGVAVTDRKAADRELASVEDLTLRQAHELQQNRRSSFAPQAREHPNDDVQGTRTAMNRHHVVALPQSQGRK